MTHPLTGQRVVLPKRCHGLIDRKDGTFRRSFQHDDEHYSGLILITEKATRESGSVSARAEFQPDGSDKHLPCAVHDNGRQSYIVFD